MRRKSVGAEGAFHCFTAIYTLISLRCVFLAQKILITPKLICGLQPPYTQMSELKSFVSISSSAFKNRRRRPHLLNISNPSTHTIQKAYYSPFLSLILRIYGSLNTILTLHLSKLFIPQSKFQSRSSFLKWFMW